MVDSFSSTDPVGTQRTSKHVEDVSLKTQLKTMCNPILASSSNHSISPLNQSKSIKEQILEKRKSHNQMPLDPSNSGKFTSLFQETTSDTRPTTESNNECSNPIERIKRKAAQRPRSFTDMAGDSEDRDRSSTDVRPISRSQTPSVSKGNLIVSPEGASDSHRSLTGNSYKSVIEYLRLSTPEAQASEGKKYSSSVKNLMTSKDISGSTSSAEITTAVSTNVLHKPKSENILSPKEKGSSSRSLLQMFKGIGSKNKINRKE